MAVAPSLNPGEDHPLNRIWAKIADPPDDGPPVAAATVARATGGTNTGTGAAGVPRGASQGAQAPGAGEPPGGSSGLGADVGHIGGRDTKFDADRRGCSGRLLVGQAPLASQSTTGSRCPSARRSISSCRIVDQHRGPTSIPEDGSHSGGAIAFASTSVRRLRLGRFARLHARTVSDSIQAHPPEPSATTDRAGLPGQDPGTSPGRHPPRHARSGGEHRQVVRTIGPCRWDHRLERHLIV